MRKAIPFVCALLLVGATVGCKDPSKSVPAAEVGTNAQPADNVQPPATPEPIRTETIALNAQNTTIEFEGSKVTGSHTGGFNTLEGTLTLAQPVDKSTLNLVIQTDSIHSDNGQLTEHLRSDDFFDVATYPTATFDLISIGNAVGADGTRQVTGTLTMKGETREIGFPATIETTDTAVNVDAEFAINRRDWGIVYDGKQDDLIRDGVVLRIKVRAAR